VKLALVTEFFYPSTGGTQTVVAGLAEALGRRGHEVTVFAPLPSSAPSPAQPGRLYETRWIRRHPWNVLGYAAVQAALFARLRTFDGIHVFHPAFGLGALLLHASAGPSRGRRASMPSDCRMVATLMGYDTVDYARMRLPKRWISRAVCQWADVVTAPSVDLANRGRAAGAKRPIEIVPHGVAVEVPGGAEVAALRRHLGITEDVLVCVSIQRHEPVKEPSALLQAWSRVARPDRRLILVGGGSLLDSLRRQMTDSGLSGVVIAGEVPHGAVLTYLALADVFVHHARYESFGMAIVEAMAAGLPVVAARVGAVPEILTHEKDGLLVPPGDASALAAAVERLLGDAALRDRLGAAARLRAADYDWESIAGRYERLYERGRRE